MGKNDFGFFIFELMIGNHVWRKFNPKSKLEFEAIKHAIMFKFILAGCFSYYFENLPKGCRNDKQD